MLDLLKTILVEYQEIFARIKNNSIPRKLLFSELSSKIKVAIGMRRSGKTYFLMQQIQKLIDSGIPQQRILYINFEDDRLLPCDQKTLGILLESFYKLYPENHDNTCYFFLDEIQNVENWPVVIRRFFDTKNIQIYLSGFSAKLLSKEIATSLRGRSIATEIWPFNFHEYLIAKDFKTKHKILAQKDFDILYNFLIKYLSQGGFPETILLENIDSRQILQDYVELVIMRDIVERYSIKNIVLLKYMLQTLLKNTACSFSVNKFAKDLKSQGISGSRSVIYEYLDYIEDAYMVFSVPLFSESLRKTQSNPRKIYAVDPGLVKAFSLSLNNNYGHLFENLLFLHLKRLGHKIYYYLTEERYENRFSY